MNATDATPVADAAGDVKAEGSGDGHRQAAQAPREEREDEEDGESAQGSHAGDRSHPQTASSCRYPSPRIPR